MIQINHIWVVPNNFVFEIKVGLLFAWLTTSKQQVLIILALISIQPPARATRSFQSILRFLVSTS